MAIGVAFFRAHGCSTKAVDIYAGDTLEDLRNRSKIQSFKGVRVTYRYF